MRWVNIIADVTSTRYVRFYLEISGLENKGWVEFPLETCGVTCPSLRLVVGSLNKDSARIDIRHFDFFAAKAAEPIGFRH